MNRRSLSLLSRSIRKGVRADQPLCHQLLGSVRPMAPVNVKVRSLPAACA